MRRAQRAPQDYGKRGRTPDGESTDPVHFPRALYTGGTVEQRGGRYRGGHANYSGSGAEVWTAAKRKVAGGASVEVEALGVRELRGVAVSGGEHQDDALSPFDARATYRKRRSRSAENRAGRAGVTQKLIHCLRQKLWLVSKAIHSGWTIQQLEPSAGEKTRQRLRQREERLDGDRWARGWKMAR